MLSEQLRKDKDALGHGSYPRGLRPSEWKLPPEPGTVPVKPGYVRLYHQTRIENLGSLKHRGIEPRQPFEGPFGIYADEQGFYGKPSDRATVEFQVPKERWNPPFVTPNYTPGESHPDDDKVLPKDIIAVHYPWHERVRYAERDPKLLQDILAGKHDSLLDEKDYGRTIRYIKHKYGKKVIVVKGKDASKKVLIALTKAFPEQDWTSCVGQREFVVEGKNIAARVHAVLSTLGKGEPAGHPFRGNQYTDVGGGNVHRTHWNNADGTHTVEVTAEGKRPVGVVLTHEQFQRYQDWLHEGGNIHAKLPDVLPVTRQVLAHGTTEHGDVTPGQLKAVQDATLRIRRMNAAAYSSARQAMEQDKWARGGADIKTYLDTLATFQEQHQFPAGEKPPARWVLEHGKVFPFDDSSFAGERQEMKQCFKNATKAVLKDPDLTYVEGYVAVHGIPLEHAWTVDSHGKVIDPTIRSKEAVRGYFGVPIRNSYLKKATFKRGKYGLLTYDHVGKVMAENPGNVVEPVDIKPLRKFNEVHDPKTGEFASAGLSTVNKPSSTPETDKLLQHKDVIDVTDSPEEAIAGFLTPKGRYLDMSGSNTIHDKVARQVGTSLDKVMEEGTARIYSSLDFLGIEISRRPSDAQIRTLANLARHGSFDQFAIEGRATHTGRVTTASIRNQIDEAFPARVMAKTLNGWLGDGPHIDALAKYDPNEARDERGRWTRGGGRTWADYRDAYRGDNYGSIYAHDAKDKRVGHLDFAGNDHHVLIQHIEVDPSAQHQGAATAMLEHLRREYPSAKIDWGMTTPEGTALHEAYGKTHVLTGEQIGHGYSKDAHQIGDIIHTDNVYDAVRALYENRHVELNQPREASVLIDKLAPIAQRMIALQDHAPNFNLCNVTIHGTNLFCADTLGIPRIKMPQVGGNTPKLMEHLKQMGVKVEEGTEKASYLRATQSELNGASVSRIAQKIKDPASGYTKHEHATVISRDNYILDGHHRWAAQIGIDAENNKLGDIKINVARVDLPIIDLMREASKFSTESHGFESQRWRMHKYNEAHVPAGSSAGGQFAPKGGGGGGAAADIVRRKYSASARVIGGVIHTSNVYDAVRALYENKKVELKQPRQVATLIDKLGEVAKRMIAAGEKAPNFNLCNVSVAGTNLFCADTKGIPRVKMPQLTDPKAFRKHLENDLGVKVEKEREEADHLRATQNELNGAKVAGMAAKIRSGEIDLSHDRLIVSRDNYILDGHHHWAAVLGVDAADNKLSQKMRIARVDMDIISLLKEAQKYSGPRKTIDKYSPDQQRDYHGRFAAGGGSSTAEEELMEGAAWSKQVLENARFAAEKNGFDPSKISVSDEVKPFTVGGVSYKTAGEAWLEEGIIKLYPKIIAPGDSIPVTVHEIEHHKFHAFEHDLEEESRNVRHDPETAFGQKGKEPGMRPDGSLRPDLAAKYPLYSAYHQITDREPDGWNKMIEDDGVTKYSYDWWQAWHKGEAKTSQAMHETLAEIARLDLEHTGLASTMHYGLIREDKYPEGGGVKTWGYGKALSPQWRDLYNLVNKNWDDKHKWRSPDQALFFPEVTKYSPDQARDWHGRFSSGGGTLHDETRDKYPNKFTAARDQRRDEYKQVVLDIAQREGFPEDKLFFYTGVGQKLQGVKASVMGDSHSATGNIRIFLDTISSEATARRVAAHEIMHQKFDLYLRDHPEIKQQIDNSKSELFRELMRTDGMSDYSYHHWESWLERSNNPSTISQGIFSPQYRRHQELPIHETLAEMAGARAQQGWHRPVSEAWDKLYGDVHSYWLSKQVAKFNAQHQPAGSHVGGQFAPKGGGDGRRAPSSEIVAVPRFLGATQSVEVLINPKLRDAKALASATGYNTVRVLRDDDGNIYMWDADASIHSMMEQALGLHIDAGGADMWALERGKFRSDNGIVADQGVPDRQWAIPKEWMAGVRGRAMAKRLVMIKYDPDEPRDYRGRWTSGGGVSANFVSPNVDVIDFHSAEGAIDSARQKALRSAMQDVDHELGLHGVTSDVIGAWSDGAENSVLGLYKGLDWNKAVAAAVMKGHLANQKAVLVFQQGKGTEHLSSFHVTGDLEKVHKDLLASGLSQHTLCPSGKGAVVYIYGEDQKSLDAAAAFTKSRGINMSTRIGHGKFIGTQIPDGKDNDAAQRADARKIYQATVANTRGSNADRTRGAWDRIHARYGQSLDAVKKMMARINYLRHRVAALQVLH